MLKILNEVLYLGSIKKIINEMLCTQNSVKMSEVLFKILSLHAYKLP